MKMIAKTIIIHPLQFASRFENDIWSVVRYMLHRRYDSRIFETVRFRQQSAFQARTRLTLWYLQQSCLAVVAFGCAQLHVFRKWLANGCLATKASEKYNPSTTTYSDTFSSDFTTSWLQLRWAWHESSTIRPPRPTFFWGAWPPSFKFRI